MLKAIDCSNTFFETLKLKSSKGLNKNEELNFLTNNLRMTICELG